MLRVCYRCLEWKSHSKQRRIKFLSGFIEFKIYPNDIVIHLVFLRPCHSSNGAISELEIFIQLSV